MTNGRVPPPLALCMAAAWLALVTWPRSDARPDPPRRLPHARCMVPSRAGATAAVLAHEPWMRRAQLRGRRSITAELDGRPPAEVVVTAEVTRTPDSPDECADPDECPERRLWVVGCVGGRPRVVAARTWPANAESERGTFEVDPGFTVLAAERVVEPGVDVLRVEYAEAQGGHDPRYFGRELELLRLEGGRLATLFRCELEDTQVSGPARAGSTMTRQIAYGPGWPRGITAWETPTYDPGALGDPEEIAEDQHERHLDTPRDTGPPSGAYTFRGGRYRATGNDVCVVGDGTP